MSAAYSFKIRSEPSGPGRGGWFWVRVYRSVEEVRAAAHKHHPWNGRDHWNNVSGCCQPAPYRERVDGSGNFEPILSPNHFAGVIRLPLPFSWEMITHEVAHAAMHIYRTGRADYAANFGDSLDQSEEDYCYILGELMDEAASHVLSDFTTEADERQRRHCSSARTFGRRHGTNR